jgi:phosphatidylserine/phosphatidylglycerophosphate/cardiolipin synthase-like enzyme
LPKLRDAYGNSKSSGYTIDFFELTAMDAKSAMLASPFFSFYDPIEKLTKRGCEVKLIVRLCSVTTPSVIAKALADPLVTLRYFTSREFHAKFYIVDDQALVGSANLTAAGLMSNREISIVVRKDRDAAFNELPGLFELYWGKSRRDDR